MLYYIIYIIVIIYSYIPADKMLLTRERRQFLILGKRCVWNVRRAESLQNLNNEIAVTRSEISPNAIDQSILRSDRENRDRTEIHWKKKSQKKITLLFILNKFNRYLSSCVHSLRLSSYILFSLLICDSSFIWFSTRTVVEKIGAGRSTAISIGR